MKISKYFYGFGVVAILLLGFNNCNRDVSFQTEVSDQLKVKDIIVGNPLVSKILLAKMCKLITSCHPELSMDDCNSGLMNLTGVEFQLGVPGGTTQRYSDIVQAEEGGTIHPNITAADTCASAIEKLTCSDASVQGAYDSNTKSPFAGVAFMIPTLPGSCPGVFSQPMARTEYFVSPSGSDLNDGSVSKPWATITHAASVLVAGSEGATVHVAPGNYSPPTSPACSLTQGYSNSCGIRTEKSGTPQAPIIYISDEMWGAKIISGGAYSAWYNLGDYVHIIGFEVIGSAATNIGIQNDGSFVRIESNHVHDVPVSLGCSRSIGGGGIVHTNLSALEDDSIGNRVHDIGPFPGSGLPPSAYCNHAHGIYHQQPRGRIQNNLIYRVGAWAIITWYNATEMQITNNLVFDSGSKDSTGAFLGGGIAVSSKVSIDDTTVSNNIIRNNSAMALTDRGSSGTNNIFQNNILYGNGQNFVLRPGTTVTGSILVDPLMVNFKLDGGGDYHLQTTSPAVNAGSNVCAGKMDCMAGTDSTGFLRIYGPAIDIGPVEWHE